MLTQCIKAICTLLFSQQAVSKLDSLKSCWERSEPNCVAKKLRITEVMPGLLALAATAVSMIHISRIKMTYLVMIRFGRHLCPLRTARLKGRSNSTVGVC